MTYRRPALLGLLATGATCALPTVARAQDAAVDAAAIPSTSLWDIVAGGGPWVIPIAVCSFVLVLAVLERAYTLRRGRIAPTLFIERFLLQVSEGAIDRHDALLLCDEDGSLVADVFEAALRKWGKPAVEVEQAVLDEGERSANQMRRFLRVINGVATVCPLFGLLGTVWGMIEAFNAIASSGAMGRPEMLAGGISGALLSTAAGLLVAIPALILYLFFVGRVDALVTEIDRAGQELVNMISAEAIEDRRSRKTRKAA